MPLTLLAALIVAGPFDLVIRNARVADGTGNPTYQADVAIRGDRIVAMGRDLPKGRREVEGRGLVVAPGFIDVHIHSEGIGKVPRAENLVRMGMTTIVTGNCGSSRLDVGKFLREVDRKVGVNVATLIGHNTVREKAMGGSFDRPPTPKEMAAMRRQVDRAMREGAVGLSTGLIYDPGVFSKPEEIIELARVIRPYDGIYASHMRNEGDQILEALAETFRIGREAQVRVEVSHVKLGGRPNWGRHQAVLQAIESARSEGIDVTQDQYVYTAAATSMSTRIPAWAREGDKLKERLADPATKAKIVADMHKDLAEREEKDYGYVQVRSWRTHPEVVGKRVPEACRLLKRPDTLEGQTELMIEMSLDGAGGVFHGMDEGDLKAFLAHPHTMVACDGGAADPIGGAGGHPRSFGNNARVLARYVRELGVLRLEDAIRRMTSLPATTMRLENRGILRPGAFADVVLFDPARVQDRATYEEPQALATGFRLVLVNGVTVVENDRHTDARPGRALRRAS
ncbi:MAG: N-acyl-D-amino-acid deacylase family protein [Fimbriimonas sp.]